MGFRKIFFGHFTGTAMTLSITITVMPWLHLMKGPSRCLTNGISGCFGPPEMGRIASSGLTDLRGLDRCRATRLHRSHNRTTEIYP